MDMSDFTKPPGSEDAHNHPIIVQSSRQAGNILPGGRIPPLGELLTGSARLVHIMRNIVKQHQACPHRVFKIQDVQACRGLVQPVTVAACVKPQQAADEQSQGGFMRNHQHIFPPMLQNNLPDDRQRPGNHVNACFAAFRRKSERVFIPGSILHRELCFHIRPAQALPVSMVNLTQPISLDGCQAVRYRQNGCRLDGAYHGAAIHRRDGIIRQALRQLFCLVHALRRKLDRKSVV